MADSLNILVTRQFANDFEENLENSLQIGKLCTTKFESNLTSGDEVKVIMPGTVTEADWDGGDLNDVELVEATELAVKVTEGKQLNFEIPKTKEKQIANAGANAPKLIKEYSNNGVYKFRNAIDIEAGKELAANAGYVIGGTTAITLSKDNIVSYLSSMKTKFSRGTDFGTAFFPGKMIAVLPPEITELLPNATQYQYTETGLKNITSGEVMQVSGWKIVESNNTPQEVVGEDTVHSCLFGVEGESGAIVTQKAIELIPYMREKSLNKAFKGGGMFGTKGKRGDKTGLLKAKV